jgi:hypothetical protein
MFLVHLCVLSGFGCCFRIVGNGSEEAAMLTAERIRAKVRFMGFCFERSPLSNSGRVPYWKELTYPTSVA